MNDLTLEKEFSIAVWEHKASVVLAALIKFFIDLQQTNTTELEDTPQELACEYLRDLLNNRELFDRKYEEIWDQIKEFLP